MNNFFAQAHNEAVKAAVVAADDYLQNELGGQDNYPCGFAWVMAYPEHKGNTRLGKQERKDLEAIGFRAEYGSKGYRLSNPGQYRGQNVDAAYAGAKAYADVFKAITGAKVYASERLD